MFLKKLLLAGAISLAGASGAVAACSFENTTPIKSMSNSYEAWKVVTDAMAECGNFSAELDSEFQDKQPAAFAANPSLYQIGGVSNSTMIPLLNAGDLRPLDDLIEKYGQNLSQNQLIKVDGKTMAIAMMVNAQHLMYRADIFEELGIDVPKSYNQVLEAAEKIEQSGKVDYPLGGTFKTGWNLGEEFINMYLGEGEPFFDESGHAAINNGAGVYTLNMLKKLSEYMDPEYLVSDSTYVQQQFQQGKIAMANLWASRATAMDDAAESQVVGKVKMAGAPMGSARPASSIWWDGFVIADNITDEEAEAAFRLIMEGLDEEMVTANNDVSIWLVKGYQPGSLAQGAAETAAAGAAPYPASPEFGLMHTALGNGVSAFLTGEKDAETTLTDIEAAYLIAAKEAGLVD